MADTVTIKETATKAAKEVVTQSSNKSPIERDKLLAIAENTQVLKAFKKEMQSLHPESSNHLKSEIVRNQSDSTDEENQKLAKLSKELDATDNEDANLSTLREDFENKDLSGIANKLMKTFEKLSDALAALGPKTLNTIIKMMAGNGSNSRLVEFLRAIAGSDKAQLQGALNANGLVLVKGDSDDAAAMEKLKEGYDEKAKEKYEAYQIAFKADPKNQPIPAPTPAPVAPVAGAAPTTPVPAPTTGPQPMAIDQYKEATYTFEKFTNEWLAKAVKDKSDVIGALKSNGKGKKAITLEALVNLKKNV